MIHQLDSQRSTQKGEFIHVAYKKIIFYKKATFIIAAHLQHLPKGGYSSLTNWGLPKEDNSISIKWKNSDLKQIMTQTS